MDIAGPLFFPDTRGQSRFRTRRANSYSRASVLRDASTCSISCFIVSTPVSLQDLFQLSAAPRRKMQFKLIGASLLALASTLVSSAGVKWAGVNIPGFEFGCDIYVRMIELWSKERCPYTLATGQLHNSMDKSTPWGPLRGGRSRTNDPLHEHQQAQRLSPARGMAVSRQQCARWHLELGKRGQVRPARASVPQDRSVLHHRYPQLRTLERRDHRGRRTQPSAIRERVGPDRQQVQVSEQDRHGSDERAARLYVRSLLLLCKKV